MPEVLNVPVFLNTLRSNDKYREEFTDIAEEVKADIISFQDNPKCGCRKQIYNFIEKNVESETLKAFFKKWKPLIPNLFTNLKPDTNGVVKNTPNGPIEVGAIKDDDSINLPPNIPSKIMVGHVVEIPPSPEEYKNLLDHGKKDRWFFRGLSVLQKDDKWLVFFY